jgi:hypothetical protein
MSVEVSVKKGLEAKSSGRANFLDCPNAETSGGRNFQVPPLKASTLQRWVSENAGEFDFDKIAERRSNHRVLVDDWVARCRSDYGEVRV